MLFFTDVDHVSFEKANETRQNNLQSATVSLQVVIVFPDKEVKKSSFRRRLDAELDKLNDKELSVIEATVIGLCKAKEPED